MLISSVLLAQQPPLTREYIRLGGRVVAIENASQGVVLNPTFNPGSGNYSTAQTVQIATATPNALIRYTIDGTTPTSTFGTLYGSPFTISTTTTVKAIAYKSGMTDSAVSSATYTFSVGSSQAIQIFNTGLTSSGALGADASVDAHYTLFSSADSSYPGPNALVTNSSWPVASGVWVYPNGPSSKWISPRADQATPNYNTQGDYTYRTTFDLTGLDPSTASLSGWAAADNSAVVKLNGVQLASIAGFGSPSNFSLNSSFIGGVNTLDFVVNNAGGSGTPTGLRVEISGTANAVGGGQVANPTFNPVGGTYPSPQTVSINSATPNALIRYTTDGTNPTSTSGNLYSGAFTISTTTTVKAIAYKGGMTDSGVIPATYTISASSQAIPIFNTGLTSSGALGADGSIDAHYTLFSSADANYPGPNALVTNTSWPVASGVWVYPNGPNSKWISPRAEQGTPDFNSHGSYTYRTTFDLTGLDSSTASLNGWGAADNSAVVKLNGVQLASIAGFGSYSNFSLNSNFVAGVNTLDFVVDNGGGAPNPTGLRVEISGTANVSGGGQVQTPTFSLGTGTYNSAPTVSIASATPNAFIRYTTDGTTPTSTFGTLYSGPVTITTTSTLKAIAYKSGLTNSGVNSATYTILPSATALSPSSGSGASQTFAATHSDPGGYGNLTQGHLLFNSTLNGPQGCWVYWDSVYGFRLLDDWQTAWLPFNGSSQVSNSQCTLYTANTFVSGSGTNLTMFVNLSFSPGWAGAKNAYMLAVNAQGQQSPWTTRGTWTVPGGSVNVSISPNNVPSLQPGQSTQFSAFVTGSANTAVTWSVSGLGTVSNGNYTAPSTIPYGQYASVTATSVADPTKSATASVYLTAISTLTLMQVTPSSGSGNLAVFSFKLADPSGGSNIAWVQPFFSAVSPLDTSPQANGAQGCHMYYDRASNYIYLDGDGGYFNWVGASPVGAGGWILQNSYCRIVAQNSSVVISGQTMTLNLYLSFFSPASSGFRFEYMSAANPSVQTSWQYFGLWQVP